MNVQALYIGGPFHGTITEIPATARRQQHIESVEPPPGTFALCGQYGPNNAPIKTTLTRYVLRDDLFNDTVLCPEGWEAHECLEAHDRWKEGLTA